MSLDFGLWLLLGSYSFRGIISIDLGQGSLKSEVREQVLGLVLPVFGLFTGKDVEAIFVEILRSKKESCSTRRDLRMSPGFESF